MPPAVFRGCHADLLQLLASSPYGGATVPFGELLQPIAAEVEAPLRERVAKHVEALQDMCTRRGGDPDAAEDGAGAEGSGAGGADAESGAPPM